jgi:hypothetical protein
VQRVERGPLGLVFTTSTVYRWVCAAVLVGPLVADAAVRTALGGVDDSLPHWLLVVPFALAAWLLAWRPLLELNEDEAVVRWLGTYRIPWDDVQDIHACRALVAPRRVAFAHAGGELRAPLPWARGRVDPTFDARLGLIRDWWLERSDVIPVDEELAS